MNIVTSDPDAQVALEHALRRAQLKIVEENKTCQLRFEEKLVRGIKARMKQVRAKQ